MSTRRTVHVHLRGPRDRPSPTSLRPGMVGRIVGRVAVTVGLLGLARPDIAAHVARVLRMGSPERPRRGGVSLASLHLALGLLVLNPKTSTGGSLLIAGYSGAVVGRLTAPSHRQPVPEAAELGGNAPSADTGPSE